MVNKIGFLTPTGTSLNVRNGEGTNYTIVDNLKSTDRCVIEWNSDDVSKEWIPIRIHRESLGRSYRDGYIYGKYATLTEINIETTHDCPDYPTPDDPPAFVDFPIPGWPTMYLSSAERAVLTTLLNKLGEFIINAPDEIETNPVDFSWEVLQGAVTALDETIRRLVAPDMGVGDNKEDDTRL